MTDALDAAFACVNTLMKAGDATIDVIINSLPHDTKLALEAKRTMLAETIAHVGGQRIIETANTPEVRTGRLMAIAFAEALIAAGNHDTDRNEDLAVFWPHEPEAISPDIIVFLEQQGCTNLVAIAKVASAGMPPTALPTNVGPGGLGPPAPP